MKSSANRFLVEHKQSVPTCFPSARRKIYSRAAQVRHHLRIRYWAKAESGGANDLLEASGDVGAYLTLLVGDSSPPTPHVPFNRRLPKSQTAQSHRGKEPRQAIHRWTRAAGSASLDWRGPAQVPCIPRGRPNSNAMWLRSSRSEERP